MSLPTGARRRWLLTIAAVTVPMTGIRDAMMRRREISITTHFNT